MADIFLDRRAPGSFDASCPACINIVRPNFFKRQTYSLMVGEALRKDRGCPVEKETLKKERRGGLAFAKFANVAHNN